MVGGGAGVVYLETRRKDGYRQVLKVLFCRSRIRSLLWDLIRWNWNSQAEVRIRHFCSLYDNKAVNQRCSKEKWPLTALEMFKNRVGDHRGDIMKEIQALDEMLYKTLLKTSYNHAHMILS